jgi:Predicted nucleic acid-binding protein, contains PIN domain
VAALNARDPDHAWAANKLRPADARRPVFITTAAIAETTHLLGNETRALGVLATMLEVMRREDPEPDEVLNLMRRFSPRMDYADACAVILARRHKGAVVLTTDHRDFSIYKVPFISPRGEFRA